MGDPDRIVAVGLLTESELRMLGSGFKRAYPLGSDEREFTGLLAAIDEADRTYCAAGTLRPAIPNHKP